MSPPPPHGAAADSLIAEEQDPVLAAFLNAPLSEEPETEEERASDLEAIEDWKAGRVRALRQEDIQNTIEEMRRAAGE